MHKKVISLSLHCQRWLIRFSWDNQFHISRKCLATDTGHSSDTDISQQLEQVQSLSTCRPSILSVYDLHCVLGLFKATCALCKAPSTRIKIWTKYWRVHNSAFRKSGFLSLQMYHVWIFMCSLKKKTKHQHCFLLLPQETRLLRHNYFYNDPSAEWLSSVWISLTNKKSKEKKSLVYLLFAGFSYTCLWYLTLAKWNLNI